MQGQAIAKPRLRQDLVAEAIEESGARFIDVMDPDAGTVFRFYEVEYSIACAMDGERDVAGIVRWAQEELGLTPSPNEVRSVITTLGDLGYLDGALGAEQPAAPAAEQPAARPAATTPSAPLPVAAKAYDEDATSIGNLSDMAPAPAGPATVARLQLKRTPASGMPAQKPLLNKDPRRDDDLAPGVLVGSKQAASVEAGDFELGASGGHAPATAAPPPVAAVEAAADLELGASGTSASREETAAEVIDIPLGVSGPGATGAAPPARDVSLDLSDQMAVGLADVKEAVRASKVIEAVEEPKAEPVVEKPAAKAATPPATPPARPSDKAIAKPAAPAVPKAAEKPVEKADDKAAAKAAEKPAAKAAEKPAAKAAEKPAAKAAEKSAAKAAEKPTAKAAAKPAVEPPRGEAAKPIAPSSGGQRRMLLLFVLLVAVAGAFFVWHYGLFGHKAEPADTEDTSATRIHKKPAPPAPEVQKLSASQAAAQELKPGMTGPIDMIVADGTAVTAGAVIATIGGHERLDKAVADEQKDLAKIPDELAGYEKERDQALAANKPAAGAAADKKIKDANDRLEQHKQTLATRQSELDKYQIKAPVAGKVTAMSKVGARVTPADVVASLAPTPSLTATFKLPAGMSLSSDAPVRVQRQADKRELICAAAIDSGAVKVTCDGAVAADGDAITLLGQAPPGEAPTMAGSGSGAMGSAAGSAAATPAATGSGAKGSAAAGSAPAAAGSAAGSAAATPAAAGSAAAVAPRPRPRPRPRPTPTATPDGGGDTAPPSPPPPAPTPAPAPAPTPDPAPATP